jgi:hypothetical protein
MKVFFSTNFNSGIVSYSIFEFTASIADTYLDSSDVEFSWNFGDGNSAVGAFVTHTFSRPGIYKVYVEAAVYGSEIYSYHSYVNVEYNFSYNPIENNFSPHKIFKSKEDKNIGEIIQQLAICPIFYESPDFFNEFLSGIFGKFPNNPNSDLGIVLYEKISNFSNNHSDIDTCNIKQLFNIGTMLDSDKDNLMLNYPPAVSRLLDIGSINVNRLFGDFYHDEFYFPDKLSTFTPNASSSITSIEATISANTFIAIRNRLKNKDYQTVFTPVINLSSVYNLTDLAIYLNWEESWWNSNYYYYYTPVKDTNQASGVIDWSNIQNSFSNSEENKTEWLASGGFLENMFAYELYKGLDLLGKSDAAIQVPAVFWHSSLDSNWYNLANWYFDESLKFPATSLPSIGSNLFLQGSIKPVIDICDSRWTPPSSINVGSLGISVTAASAKPFNTNIIGSASPLIFFNENVIFATEEYYIPSLFWYSSSQDVKDWYNLSCWYGDKDLKFKSSSLPLSGSNLKILGFVRPEIDLDDSKWSVPSSIDVGVAGVLVKSNYGRSFDCNVTGHSSPLIIFNIRSLYANLT